MPAMQDAARRRRSAENFAHEADEEPHAGHAFRDAGAPGAAFNEWPSITHEHDIMSYQ